MPTSRRGALFATLLTATLALSPLGAAHAQPTEEPAEAAAGWLTTHIDDEFQLVTGFGPSAGSTIDAVLAFDAAGVADGVATDVAASLAAQAAAYASFPDVAIDDPDTEVVTWVPGSLGKLLLLSSSRPELDPTALGGVDAVAELEALECTEVRETCTPEEFGAYKGIGAGAPDTVSTFGQALAIIGLVATGGEPSPEAVAFLTRQACDDGGYDFARRPDGQDCTSAADTTGLVAQALLAAGNDDAAEAIAWLLDNQQADGGFVGFAGVDANSTAYPVMALLAAGETAAAAAGIEVIAALQAGCDAPEDEVGAIYYNEPDENGQTEADNVVATAQATPALAGQHLLQISGAGSSDLIPVLDCPVTEPVDDPAPEATDETHEAGTTGDATDAAGTTGDPTGSAGDSDRNPGDAQDTSGDGERLPETGVGLSWLIALGAMWLFAGAVLLRRHGARTAA